MSIHHTPAQLTGRSVQQRVSQDFAFLASGGTKTGGLSNTEIALLSATALVVGLGVFKATRPYAVWTGGLILLAWGAKFYKTYLE